MSAIRRVLLVVKANAWSKIHHHFSYISDSQGKLPGHHRARLLWAFCTHAEERGKTGSNNNTHQVFKKVVSATG